MVYKMADETLKRYFPLLIFISFATVLFMCNIFSIISISAVFLIFLVARADGDFILLLSEKFGKDPYAMKGKVIWITGASSGLGEGIALSLAKLNCRLVLSARTEAKLEDVKKRCLECSNLESKDILVLPFDMVDYKKHEAALSSVLEHFGQLDILVSNAGRSQRARWEMIEIEVDKELFELNVFSLVSLSRLVTKHFQSAGKGHHVVTLSVASIIGVPASCSYTGAKHAVRGYFESLRMEKSSQGISVTILCPGPVESNLMESCFGEKAGKCGYPKRTSKLMSTERFSHLASTAIANRLSEAWICPQPVLLLMYLYQYTPALIKWVISSTNFLGLAMTLRDGRKGPKSFEHTQ